jgi:hypothetical protein
MFCCRREGHLGDHIAVSQWKDEGNFMACWPGERVPTFVSVADAEAWLDKMEK